MTNGLGAPRPTQQALPLPTSALPAPALPVAALPGAASGAALPGAALPGAALPEAALPATALPGSTAPGAAHALPAPRLGDAPAARLWMPPARPSGVVEPDVVVFTAACPACGDDTEWVEHREDTRLRITVSCPCD